MSSFLCIDSGGCKSKGFVVALITAAQYIRSGTFRNILVVGADALSRFVDWTDRCA